MFHIFITMQGEGGGGINPGIHNLEGLNKPGEQARRTGCTQVAETEFQIPL